MFLIGVISDSHGLLRREVKEMLKDAELIIHAGDIGTTEVLKELESIAEVRAVRGNIDSGAYAEKLNISEYISVAGRNIYVIHNIDHLDIDPRAADVDIVIYGHSHKAVKGLKNGILFFNPGSIGPKRFSLPVSMGIIKISDDTIEAEIIEL